MALVRAFTQRTKRPDMPSSTPARSLTIRKPGQSLDRSLISSPTLLSTTNVHYRNAVDIQSLRNVSNPSSGASVSSRHSADDSDSSMMSDASRETFTDASSVDFSPTSPEPNHLSGYFKDAQAPRRSMSSGKIDRKSSTTSVLSNHSPAVPPRANSHSKKAHEQLARQRSMRQTNSTPNLTKAAMSSMQSQSSNGLREQRSSFDMFRGSMEPEHPFGRELEKLTEVAEEFGDVVRTAETQEDVDLMQKRGLAKFCADDYLAEIRPLFLEFFKIAQQPRHLSPNSIWI